MSMCTSAIKMGAHVLIFAWPNAPYAHWSCLVYIIIIANCVFCTVGGGKSDPFQHQINLSHSFVGTTISKICKRWPELDMYL